VEELCLQIVGYVHFDSVDQWSWVFDSSGKFLVKSAYATLRRVGMVSDIWRLRWFQPQLMCGGRGAFESIFIFFWQLLDTVPLQ